MYIVTGAAGLIGSCVVWKLNGMGITDILAVDHLSNGLKWKNLTPLKFADYMEKGDFRKMISDGSLDKMSIDGVLHLGACSSTTETDASYLVDNNYRYTKELADYCVRRGVRMVYASSCATYGDGTNGYDDNEDRIERLRPLNMYGYSKQLFDLYAKRKGYLKELVGCKFSNIYGPNESHKAGMRSVALLAYEQITATGCLELFKSYRDEYQDGEQMRDFLYVKDAVDMVMFLFLNQSAHGIFNVGSGKAETWNALAKAAFDALGKPVSIRYVDMPDGLRERYQYYTLASTEKIRSLGYDAKPMTLGDAVADYYRNYLAADLHLGDEK